MDWLFFCYKFKATENETYPFFTQILFLNAKFKKLSTNQLPC